MNSVTQRMQTKTLMSATGADVVVPGYGPPAGPAKTSWPELKQTGRNPLRQTASFAVVVLLHICLFYVLVSASHRGSISVLPHPLMTRIIEEVKPPQQLASLTPPKMVIPPAPFVPLPEVKVTLPPSPNAITVVSSLKPVAGEPMTRSQSEGSLEGKAEWGHVAPRMLSEEACKPLYPPASRRLEQKGTTRVMVLVDVDGKVVQSKISQSSGHPWLDEAALSAISACAFVPGTVNGHPERVWHIVPYTFSLE